MQVNHPGPFKVYGDILSGNCYKIKLLATLLDLEHEWIAMEVLSGETRADEFLQMNPNGRIPVIVLDDGSILTESNAILNYLAEGSAYLPDDRLERAKVLQWQFFEQYSHEPYIAVARFIEKFLGLPEERRAEYESKRQGGYAALGVMEHQLAQTPYLIGDDMTIADISLYAYTHVSHEGGFALDDYPAVRAWVQRIATLPRYVGME